MDKHSADFEKMKAQLHENGYKERLFGRMCGWQIC